MLLSEILFLNKLCVLLQRWWWCFSPSIQCVHCFECSRYIREPSEMSCQHWQYESVLYIHLFFFLFLFFLEIAVGLNLFWNGYFGTDHSLVSLESILCLGDDTEYCMRRSKFIKISCPQLHSRVASSPVDSGAQQTRLFLSPMLNVIEDRSCFGPCCMTNSEPECLFIGWKM